MALFCIIQLKYGYEGYRQFPLPETEIYVLKLFYCTDTMYLCPFIYTCWVFMTMWISNVTLLCQDYVMVRRLSLRNFCRNLAKTLSIMALRRNKYSLHNYAYRYFVLIMDSHVHITCFVKWLFHFFEFPVVCFHLRS